MNIGIPKEIKNHEYRLGMTPAGVRALHARGHSVLIEAGAGQGCGIEDAVFEEAGGKILSSRERLFSQAELIVKVKEPHAQEFPQLQKGQIIFSFLHLAVNLPLTEILVERGVTAIAYETVALEGGQLPLLKPMSEIAGRLAIQNGAFYLQRAHGGRGVLLSGVPGVERGCVVILGGGTVGSNAARIALGLGARVIVLDRDVEQLWRLDQIFGGRVETEMADEERIERHLLQADLTVGAVLVAGAKAPVLASRKLVRQMKKGSVVVDVAVDQGGCFETSRPTTHTDPVYIEEGVLHYCVPNMPGAVPRTSTGALVNVTLPYVQKIADLGLDAALRSEPALRRGLNVHQGSVRHEVVARAHGMKFES